MKLPVPKPVSAGLILSYRCSAACRHCMYACSPRWEDDWIKEKDLAALLSQLAKYIQPAPYGPESISFNHGLHFTGGEPGLHFERLCEAVDIAHGLGLPSTFVETNAVWCTDDGTTRRKLAELRARGLKGIMISVNPFYAEFVPFSRTERCIREALDVFGNNVVVYQLEYYKRFKAWGFSDRVPLEAYLNVENGANLFRNVEFFISGRAPYALAGLLEGHFPRYPAARLLSAPCSPPFLRQWHNHFDNYGNYMPGFCGGISFGDGRHLDRLLSEGIDAEKKPILEYIVHGNFEGLLAYARRQGFKEISGGYFSKCHLCIDIRKHLVKVGTYEELTPEQFYENVDAESEAG